MPGHDDVLEDRPDDALAVDHECRAFGVCLGIGKDAEPAADLTTGVRDEGKIKARFGRK